MSLRRFMALARHLPVDGAFALAKGWRRSPSWGQTEELIAIVADAVMENSRLFVMANTDKGTKKPEVITVPRPGPTAEPPKRRNATPQELRKLFGGAIRYQSDEAGG